MTDSHADPQSPDVEPETPVWLPALGFALFVVGGVAWAVTPPVVSATPPPLPPPIVAPATPPPAPQAAPPSAPQPVQAPPANPPQPLQRPGGPVPKQLLPGAHAPGALPLRPAKKQP
ncbi:MAG TPA: hypothetical protein VK762_20725 [Polyangiaceae bacterium]|nr:hypothetical protein [Polyangiaceae bacterium]